MQNNSWNELAAAAVAIGSTTSIYSNKYWAVLHNEGPRRDKPGAVYVHTAAAADQQALSRTVALRVKVASLSAATEYTGKYTVSLGFLRSYEAMGKFKVRVLECDGSEHTADLDGLWDTHSSTSEEAVVAVASSPEFLVYVTPEPEASRGENKIKLLSLLVTS